MYGETLLIFILLTFVQDKKNYLQCFTGNRSTDCRKHKKKGSAH